MLIPWDQLKNKFIVLADELIEEINATIITINYTPISNLTSANGDLNLIPGIIDQYGGRIPIQSLPGRINEIGSNLNEIPLTEEITVRSYWLEGDSKKYQGFNKQIFTDGSRILRINSYTSDNDKLNNASFIEVSGGGKLKLLTQPVSYSISKRYSISHWYTINE